MPYLNCPSCRLVVRTATTEGAQDCPRCSAKLSKRPRRLFVVDLPRDKHASLVRDLAAPSTMRPSDAAGQSPLAGPSL